MKWGEGAIFTAKKGSDSGVCKKGGVIWATETDGKLKIYLLVSLSKGSFFHEFHIVSRIICPTLTPSLSKAIS